MSCTLYLIYSRLCWCLILILILVLSSALTWLTHIILVVLLLGCLIYMLLNHMFVANARLLFLSMPAWNCFVFLLILGEWWSYFMHLHPNTKKIVHKSWGASLFSLEHSFAQIIIFFYPFGSSDHLIACFTLCYANEINLCHELCAMYLAIMTRLKLYNSGFTCGYHVLINCNLCMNEYTSFFMDTYHDYYWPHRNFYTWKSSYLRIWLHYIDSELL